MENTPSIGESFHINKLLDYLPIIIISVIVLVGFFTWDVIRKQLGSFMMLILVVIYALWVMSADVKTYREWFKGDANNSILPPPSTPPNGWRPIVGIIVSSVVAIAGIGLGFGSIGINANPPTVPFSRNIGALQGIGGIFSIGGIVLVIYSLWKIFRDTDTPDTDADKSYSKKLGFGGFIASVIGIYMFARAKILENDKKDIDVEKIKEDEYKKDPANNGANTMLFFGLIIQVIAYACLGGLMYKYEVFNVDRYNFNQWSDVLQIYPSPAFDLSWFVFPLRVLGFAFLFLCGILFIAQSQEWPGFGTLSKIEKSEDFIKTVFAAHGGIYMIIASIFLVLILGGLKKTLTYHWSGWILVVLFIGCYIWNIMDMAKQRELTPEQKGIIRAELNIAKKKENPDYDVNSPEAATDFNNKIREIENKQNEQNPTSNIVNGVFMTLSVVIIVMITIFRTARLRMGICGEMPKNDSFWANITPFIDPIGPKATGQPKAAICTGLDGTTTNLIEGSHKAVNKITEGNIDNITGTEWDDLLNKYNENTATWQPRSVVRAAKGAAWNPFLLVILIVLWVAIIFTRVSTSDATKEWIIKAFSPNMYSKVKELIDTFFIVLIVGLLLCGILLLPVVKELNVGGLDTILRFAESIQVWQYDDSIPNDNKTLSIIAAIVGAGLTAVIGLWWWWYNHLIQNKEQDDFKPVPDGWGWGIALVILFAITSIPGWYFIASPHGPSSAFKPETFMIRWIRLFFTAIYLIPWLFITVFKLILFSILAWFTEDIRNKLFAELGKLNFTKWTSSTTDLRLFTIGDPIDPNSVSSTGAAIPVPAPAPGPAPGIAAAAAATTTTIEQTKVDSVGKLIKVVFLTISFVILILSGIYMVYKVGAENRTTEEETSTGGFVAQLDSPTARTIYVVIAIVGIAGFVAYLREKFKTANSKTPEDYIFNDLKPEDSTSPMRQLTFGMTHIIYVVLMVVVWIYDKNKDENGNETMSVTGMTILGLAILFFHYVLEMLDNRTRPAEGQSPDKAPLAPMSNLLSNIRFITNTIFFIVLCVLAYYKQAGVMIALIVVMFIFHLTKSILGLKLLKILWACIIYIPCLFLDLLKGSQNAIGDTTSTIWIIVGIELLLLAILFGGPYLLNYIGASASQIVATPVQLKDKYDTNLTTQSKEIFIYHNTGIDRTKEDKAANCPPEEKKRYHYAISGWFLLNNNVTTKTEDLEIFNFGDVPKMTYNPSRNELKIMCNTLSMADDNLPKDAPDVIYNSRANYNTIVRGASFNDRLTKTKTEMALDEEILDADIPLQRWNYFVINYDGKTMDFFLNNKLITKSDFIMPNIELKPITVGDKEKGAGLNGSICNFAFHKYPLTKEQIRWTYTMLKTQNPPMVGTATIKDEIKSTGSTTIYSQ
jgi:drug/metabolite transporter superfamily protein YnfA